MYIRILKYAILFWCCTAVFPALGQQLPNCLPGSQNLPIATGEINFNYGSGTDLYSNKNRSSATVGQPMVGDAFSNKYFTESGFWARFLLPPQAPYLVVSQGDFPDRILIKWSLDPLSSGPTGGYVITRDGSFLDQVDPDIDQYIDFNVQAGEVYTYGVYGLNNFGRGAIGKEIGFVNPNGVITGKVSTISGNPVPNCAVSLSPTTGTSLQFNGNDNIYVEYDSRLPRNQFTVFCWVKLEGINDNTGIIDFGSAISKNWWLHTTTSATGKGVVFSIGSGSPATIQAVFPDSTRDDWHHVAATFNGSNFLLYLDGELIGTSPATISADSIPLYFGQKSAGNGFFNGKLDDIRILDKQLSQTDIQMTMDKTSSSKTDGLVAYWKMDEGVGSKIFDFSPNRFVGFLCGPTWASDKAPVTSSGITDEAGFYSIEGINYKGGTTFVATASKSFFSNLSLEFNGVNSQWADLTDFDIPDSTTIAISLKPFDLANQQVILSKEDGSTQHFILWLDGNQLKLTMGTETFNFGTLAMGFHLLHFVLERQGSNTHVTFYQNGNLLANHDFADSASDWSSGTPWTLAKKQGVGSAQQFFTGLIDEVVYYKELLDLPTIQLINSLGTDPSSAAIITNFPLNEGQDTIITDLGEAMTGDGVVHGAGWAMSARIMSTSPHLFQPGIKLVTLDPSNTSTDGIDFIDQSTIPVSGFLRYDGTECFAVGAEILVNGDHARPPVFTDKNGKFVLDLEPGQTAKLSTTYKGHVITPGFWEVRKLASPVAGILFRDKTKRTVSGTLAGGLCRKSIMSGNPGDSAIVVLESENGCYSKEFIVKETDGKYKFTNVPPFEMIVGVAYHPNPVVLTYMMDQVGGESIDLSDQNDTTDFIFFSEPQLEMSSFDTNACGEAMMVQSERQTVTMRVFQDYEGGRCYLDSADLSINNFIADAPSILDTTMRGGKIVIKFRAGQPNIVSPYLKTLAVTAKADGYESTFNQQAVVLGKRPRNVNFASTSPQIPFLILRDPPGDKSFAMLEKNSTTCTTLDLGITAETTLSQKIELKQGFDIAFATGVGFEEETKIEFENTQELETSITLGATFGTSSELCITNHEVFQTDDGDIITGKDADLYVGAAMNMLFGVTDDLRWDTMNCSFFVFPGLIVFPDKFATTFIYTDYHIRNTVIPILNSLRTKADSTSAKQWKAIVDLDSIQKKSAVFNENISFSAGTTYEKSTTSASSESTSFEFAVGVEASLAESMGFEIDGTGAAFSMGMSASLGTTIGTTSTKSKEITIGYTLGDDDIGDNFTVNIKTDKVYGTTVFETISGASSCPYEEKTVPRDEVAISSAEIVAVNVPENDAAVFHFTLGNISQTEETRAYALFSAAESNPLGAVVKANGTNLASPIGYQLPFGEGQEVTVTVERGPGGDFDYDSLEIGFYVECEDDRATALGFGTELLPRFYKAIFISAHFVKPCSSVDISSPLGGWVQTVVTGPNRNIALTGYDKTDPDLDFMLVQYRRTQGNGVWINIEEVPKDNLGPISTVVTWNTTGLSDGLYEIRAVANCTGGLGVGVSHVMPGKIERTPPDLFGLPEPADGVLSAGDEISITFNEEIRCDKLIMADVTQNNNIGLYDSQTGNLVDFKMSCSGDKIIIVPNVPNRFLENRLLKVKVDSILDLANNKFGHVEWEFNVDRNSLNWLDKSEVKVVKYEEDFVKEERKIENRGGQVVSWELGNVPDWCKIYPKAGQLLPGEVKVITFEFEQTMVFGRNLDTIQLMGAEGNEPMVVDARVICHDPDWHIDATQFDYSMNFVLELDIEGVKSKDEEDIVGAFINGELRGVSKVRYYPSINKYLVFLTVYSNVFSGEDVKMRIWDASTCQLFGSILENFTFESDDLIGSPITQQVIHTNSSVLKEIFIQNGWNWLSFNLKLAQPTPNSLLSEIDNPNDAIFKSQTQFSQYANGFGWFGSLNTVGNTSMYQLRANAIDTIMMIGAPIDPDSIKIPIAVGWNWISYIPRAPLPINIALQSLTVLNGDLVKSQTQFAQYVAGFGWIGNLTYLVPGAGYIMKSSLVDTLIYPDFFEFAPNTTSNILSRNSPVTSNWKVDPAKYEYSMTLVGFVRKDGLNVTDQDWELGAFVGTECRGSGQAIWVEPAQGWLFFLTSYSNNPGELIKFKGYDGIKFMDFREQIYFDIDAQHGAIAKPFIFELSEATANKEYQDENGYLKIIPNPSKAEDRTRIYFSTGETEKVALQIFDLAGRIVFNRQVITESGENQLVLIAKTFSSGLYTIRLTGTNRVFTEKMIIK